MEKLKENVIWQGQVRRSDVGGKSEEEINQMIIELNLALQSICWAHGIHN